MKRLLLTVTETGRKTNKFHYQVFEGDKLLAERRSDRVYAACHVYCSKLTNDEISYSLPYFYGRLDLVSKNKIACQHAYALATVNK